MQLAAKRLVFNGQPREIFGTIIRVATAAGKTACGLTTDDAYLVVDFVYGRTEYRGLWRRDDCLLIG